METIIGLGHAGCSIADKFAEYDQYKIYKIDCGLKNSKNNYSYNFPTYNGPEEYEKNCPDLSKFFKDVKGEVLFIIGGAGAISGASLRILQCLKHCEINVLYIRPETELLPSNKFQHEWVTFNVLQEYARSGVFKRVYLISNQDLEDNIGGVPVVGYFDRLNEMIVSTMHMINIYNHIEPVNSTFSEPKDICRISTIGLADLGKNEKRWFFSLDNIEEIRYYYAINKEELENNSELFKMIREQVKGDAKAGYSIYSTNYEQNLVYTVAYTSEIQRQKSEKST
tara:strand:- start:498 stop:1343 length:846 start_codon:yes stop_codon:yes gene_type:complete